MLAIKAYLLTLSAALAATTISSDLMAQPDSSESSTHTGSIRMLRSEFVLGEEVFVEVILKNVHSRTTFKPDLFLAPEYFEFDLRCSGDSLPGIVPRIFSDNYGQPQWSPGDSIVDTVALSDYYGKLGDGLRYTRILPAGHYSARARYYTGSVSNYAQFVVHPTPKQHKKCFREFQHAIRAIESDDLTRFSKSVSKLLADSSCKIYFDRVIDVAYNHSIHSPSLDRVVLAPLLHQLLMKSGNFDYSNDALNFYGPLPLASRKDLLSELKTAWPRVEQLRSFQFYWSAQ